jgi:hypothetical protein
MQNGRITGLEAGDDGAVVVTLGVIGDDADIVELGIAGAGEAAGVDAGRVTRARRREGATTGVSPKESPECPA